MELPYIAGLFDGEGTIVITGPTPTEPRRYSLQVRVSMTDERTIRALHEAIGVGSVSVCHAENWNPRAKTRYDYQVVGQAAARFLRSIQPWLVTKAEAASIGLQFADRLAAGRRGARLTDAELTARAQLKARIQEVNRRGR